MDRPGRFQALVAVAAVWLLADTLPAQQPQAPRPRPPMRMAPAPSARSLGPGIQRWQSMSPADRQRFRSNVERWQQLPPDTRRELRAREISRQQLLKQEADAAIRDAGLQMEAAKRAQFEERYLQERKRVERELRRELQEKRAREMAPVVERLKKEFTQPLATPAASTSPATSASPAK